MLKALTIAIILVISAIPAILTAAEQAPDNDATEISAIELKLLRSLDLIKGARKVVDESGSPEGSALMDEAEAASKKASKFFEAGDYGSARKAVFDSIHAAVNAIIASKGPGTGGLRDTAMNEKAVKKAERDEDQQEARLHKLSSEVETFLKVAERLSGRPDANASIAEAKKLHRLSLERSAEGDHDGALSEMKAAYRLATSGVREIKRSRGEVITFPPPALSDPKELLAYELKRNETYAFFTSQILNAKGGGLSVPLKAASAAREDALKSVRSGDTERALERIRRSTDLYIDAIKAAGR
ncbi:MAG: hypothetical protein H3C68_00010 [Deltaproteobacteria bacterium]|nr:hypothetical protein [Deltaproteobacteria bacterium]MBZ0219710.1 hypothetical protein [Deltaproteobacteria bacterium]